MERLATELAQALGLTTVISRTPRLCNKSVMTLVGVRLSTSLHRLNELSDVGVVRTISLSMTFIFARGSVYDCDYINKTIAGGHLVSRPKARLIGDDRCPKLVTN